MIYIKDDEFIRGDSPMTKEEIRILSISKMNINENSRILDIGAGTGSISIQLAKILKNGEVIAIEKKEKAIDLINKNKEKFEANNLKVVKGEALEVYEHIDGEFNVIFIGGSGGNIEDIIRNYHNKLSNKGRMVLNFITINNLYKALETLKKMDYNPEFIEVSISGSFKNTYMLKANNPIFIVWGEKNI
ncbi:precorrin-6Y C5,15-methyltransferase (decarboxylating) subunit CbiT [Clostridium botulinum]|uniref:SAM-dependent methlyltransferase n=1 Tax=Clostridium botulinum C/D str. DC5 TaxID=1443128 RepID=A0A0A0IEN4_CLOBO|nr:precorrin-6Y C5,15-methyltransferase (decarboxylating) subunit CbiT [Clostridium botulinum]KEI00350.1 SAM-dependent methlyltransferase [Clostridium botulinum C/D str. BKT75002]KEI08971.1 SAM-dependent methlyltransferase [Clostridium botulinum C/D str. BKT2873]KGM95988.1 SAM-dependent methlyltransferase [Clostridium botulinum D str. CCUG 7971]KGM99442.1 SAM-dependent methlyltransferase [Clostridium botulinum C/D str. DC5]KOC49060.1 SAM-dependent methyltransferase [Clostridium botulinum]